jgi:MFS family permease
VLVYAYDKGGLHPGEVGAAFAVGTVGLILGAIVAPRLVSIVPLGALLVLAVAVTGSSYLLLLAFGARHALIGLIVVQFVIGFADMIFNIHVQSLVQAITPDELMGRVGGTALSVVWGTGTLGSMLGGLVGAGFGVVAGLCVAGAIVIIGALILLFSPIRSLKKQPRGSQPEGRSPMVTERAEA